MAVSEVLTDVYGSRKVYNMTTTEAQELGRIAFTEGRGNFPLATPVIAAEMIGAKVGEKTHLLKAFNNGWTSANLAGMEVLK